MNGLMKWAALRAWWLGVAVASVVAGLALRSAHSEDKGNLGLVASATVARLTAEEFVNPQEVSERFCERLGTIVKEVSLPTPEELVTQMTGNTSVPVAVQPDPEKKLSSEQVYSLARKGVVIVGGISPRPGRPHWLGSFATGFVIAKDGVIVTNAHVIEAFADSKAIGVMTDDGYVYPVKSVLAADRENDVAVLKVAANDLFALPIASSVPVGASVYCISHPALDCDGSENAFYTFTQGIVSGKLRLRLGGREPVNALAITADYAQGSSGGPILNEHGAVVGMVCHTMSLCAGDDSGGTQMTWKMARPSGSILSLLGNRQTVLTSATR